MAGPRTQIGLFSLVDHLSDPITGAQTTQGERLSELVELGVLAEQVGFERFAVGEHHFSEYILPNPNLILSAVAARTRRVRLFTTVTLIALHDPLRLAEDVAVIDALSGGRVELSVARGVSEETSSAFGIDHEDPYGVMGERLESLLGMLATHRASTVAGGSLPLSPRPVQKPHPPIWIGGGLSQGSCDLAAAHGLPLILPSLFRHPEDYLPMVERYRVEMGVRSPDVAPRLGMPSYCWVAETSQEARRRFQPRLEFYIERFKSLRHGFGRPMSFDSLLRGPVICGSPAEVVDRLAHVNELLALDTHILLMDLGGVPFGELRRAVELVGAHVLPQLR
ncbi:MAG: LLM class flavin-dependent oxidoreductase [Myxococcales bacterium]|nr:LLM class flavin-dependent oxidoreductase [Myxococcales bacterium]MDD9965958.1 LLM class flavin-dependent oxidoreductase [Myxococcales bacterium]